MTLAAQAQALKARYPGLLQPPSEDVRSDEVVDALDAARERLQDTAGVDPSQLRFDLGRPS